MTPALRSAPGGTEPTPRVAASRVRARTRRRRGPALITGAVLVGLVVLAALVSLVWTPFDHDATGVGGRLETPSATHWMGTDRLGRDVFSQFLVGARLALGIGTASVLIAAVLGITLGLLAALAPRKADDAVVHGIDVLIAFPTLLLAMVLVAVRGASTLTAVLAIGLATSAVVARLTRIAARRVLVQDYVLAATASGTGRLGILLRHVLPNIYPILLVQLSLEFGLAVVAEAALSYLGLGSPPPNPSWGQMLRDAQAVLGVQLWPAVFPGLAIVITVLGLNLLGDGLREYADPELSR
ncbi:ABC transporter permease [Actinoalloteichus sp. GBA129-24]|uniref:ABC transporter permease n=1 Tax=Actinoalloteichus sp. GBA129-24 TaxID=1612551 RepID=UPI0009508D1F|nr:ABC transporter permease [Actinoalloteichus sp. GBA129-24]APU22584.1 ABC-type dipeptide/oligopeptide/nickel transport system, permease component [Actinoalloteichus sp. GBA129-24]